MYKKDRHCDDLTFLLAAGDSCHSGAGGVGRRAAGACGGRLSDSVPAGHLPAKRRSVVAAADAQDWRSAVGPVGAPMPRCPGVHCRAMDVAASLNINACLYMSVDIPVGNLQALALW